MLRKLVLYLIKPSKYDDDGYVIRHWVGVVPSNTLATLRALTEDVRRRRALGAVEIEIHQLDETVQRIPLERISRAARPPHTKVTVMLVGVQTNQFPRAADLAREFRRAGVDVWIGGFHVSGMLAMSPGVSPEIQELIDLGVTVVAGEVEGRWEALLRDIVEGTAQRLYDFLKEPPVMVDAPLPHPDPAYLRRFGSHMATLDCGRGCPFDCSFCCIINVQGRHMRCRDPQTVLAALRENYRVAGITTYFFTDDNFARNKHWETIFDGLIHLREVEGLPVHFMIQSDVLSYRIPNFVEKARRAGCTQVFLGIESANPDNLKAAGKRQNTLEDFRKLAAAWHAAGIVTHAAYIVGFPHDTPASVRENLRFLTGELKVEQASFFMLGPIPGSRDHQRLVAQGRGNPSGRPLLDPDFNRYDSFHPTMPHPHMSAEEWYALYRECWRTFYSFENMRAILSRVPSEIYWGVFRNFIWAKNAAEIEGEHPMITGFWRFKDRRTRRPGFPIPGGWVHWVTRVREKAGQIRQWAALLLEMEELWLQTRPPTRLERRLLDDLQNLRERDAEWTQSLHLPDPSAALREASPGDRAGLPTADVVEMRRALFEWTHTTLPAFLQHRRETLEATLANLPQMPRLSLPNLWDKAPAEVREWIVRAEAYVHGVQVSRSPLDRFWLRARHDLRAGKFWRVRPSQVVVNFVRDVSLTARFAWVLLTAPDTRMPTRS